MSSSSDADGVGEVDLLLANGDGTFAPGEVIGVDVPYSLATGDLDGDGDVDLVGTNASGASVSVLLSTVAAA